MENLSPKIDDIFLAALERTSPEERSAYLTEACAGDPELCRRVERLLEAQAKNDSFLEAPAPEICPTVDQPLTEGPGTVIGPYKLIEPIGEGGMGTVWMAQQTEPVKRLVAVKLIKAGMDSKQVIARFEAERQALALMDHPNIARVLDGGTTDVGRPYFVMDLVRGVPITKYCDEHRLTPRQRLELFLPVCHAIQHAHQKGIIHRDLKPTNVLVALYDGKPVPKVIDFGVAKATGQPLTEKTLVTGFGSIVGTLEYMSPEQAEINQLDIDTRSDIYSLGVLLYELLAGSTPFTKKDLEKAGMLEMLRVIREDEPSKPSTKLSTAEGLPTLAANRGTEPAKLTRLVRGELDWIVMKALEKDRGRRYETANGFAMDVQRYLADEAVQACPPSAWYRLRKFARRNKGALAVTSLVLFFLLLLGSGVGWTLRDRAARAADRANHLERAIERAELLHREGKRGEALAALERAQLLAREAKPAPPLADRIESLQQRLDAEGRDEVFVAQFDAIRREVQTEVDLQNSAHSQHKGYPSIREALEHYGIAVGVTPPAAAVTHILQRPAAIQTVVVAALDECLRHAPGDDSVAREWLIDVLQKADRDPWRNKARRAWREPATLEALAKDIDVRQQPPSFLLLVANRLPIASPSRLDLVRRVQFAYPGDFWANVELGWVLLYEVGKHAEAIRYYSGALSLRPDNPGVLVNLANALRGAGELEAAIADLRRAIAVAPRYAAAHANLGRALADQKKLDAAIDCYRTAIELDPKHANAYGNLGNALRQQGKLDAAIDCYRTVIKLEPKDAKAHFNLGIALFEQMKLDEAIGEYHKAIEFDPKYAEAHYNLGNALRDKGQLDDAIAGYREAIRLKPNIAEAHLNLGALLCDDLRDYENAAGCFRKAIELDPKNVLAHHNLGKALGEQGKLDEAIAEHREATRLNKDCPEAHNGLGVALRGKGELDNAIREFREAIRLKKDFGPFHYNLGNALRDKGRLDEAIAEYREAIGLKKDLAPAHVNLGDALLAKGQLDDAIIEFREAIRHKADFPEAHYSLGLAMGKKGQLDAAITEYRKAIRLKPDYAEAHYGLGNLLGNKGQPDDAIAEYREAIRIKPDYAEAHVNLGNALAKKGQLDTAIAEFREAIRIKKDLPEAHASLGSALAMKGQLDDAITELLKAIELDPKYAAAHNSLGAFLCDYKKDYGGAIACFRKAIELDPKYVDAHINLGNALRHQGKIEEAIASYKKSLQLDPICAEALNNLADLLATCPDAKFRDAKRAVELAKRAVELKPQEGNYWNTFGVALYQVGSWKEAVAVLEKSMQLRKGGDSFDWFFLAMAHWKLGNKAETRTWYDKAVEWMEKNQPKNEELRRFRAETEELMKIKPKKD